MLEFGFGMSFNVGDLCMRRSLETTTCWALARSKSLELEAFWAIFVHKSKQINANYRIFLPHSEQEGMPCQSVTCTALSSGLRWRKMLYCISMPQEHVCTKCYYLGQVCSFGCVSIIQHMFKKRCSCTVRFGGLLFGQAGHFYVAPNLAQIKTPTWPR